ncbi:MAG: hypothetical protein ACU836_09275 [Gammaproteobacteria bacterium]
MKKIILLSFLIFLVGCAEKAEYEQAVLGTMKKDKDVQDYKIAPERITDCVVSESSKNMPGVVAFDPERKQAYLNYTKMLKMQESGDPQMTIEELRSLFGSPKALADAHANYAESVYQCVSALVTSTEEKRAD